MIAADEWLVYVVDDDEAVRNSTCLLLESYGLATAAFASPLQFLERFDATLAICLVLDLHMPEMSGIALLELLRARGVTTPVIVISGRQDPALDILVRRAGATAVLSKPTKQGELIALVRTCQAAKAG